MVYLDNFAFFFYLIFILGAALTVFISRQYLEDYGKNMGEYYALILFATVGMMLMAAGAHLIMIFLGLEIMSIAIYVLAGLTSGIAGRPTSSYGFLGPTLGKLLGSKPNPYSGHWDDVYDYLGSGNYYNYLIGLKLEIPLENKLAKSDYAQAKIQQSQAVTEIKLKEVTIINEVRDAVREVETNIQRLATARAILKFSQETLAAEKKKYDVGMCTERNVLDFQDRLQKAMSNMALTESDYSRSLTNLLKVQGILVEEKGLTM